MPRQDIAPASRRIAACCCNSAAGTGAGYRRLSGGGLLTPSGDWDSGNPAFAISRGSSRRAAPYAWARPPVSWHAIVPFTFRVLGQPLDPEISPLISARCAGYITLRLVAQQQQSAATAPHDTDPMRPSSASGLRHRLLSTALPLDGKEMIHSSILRCARHCRVCGDQCPSRAARDAAGRARPVSLCRA
jgi:hypothetical protein